tara:strand:+ start:148 stop:594 length:447 start_codon:yes stop_codon:yes gene_type:complete
MSTVSPQRGERTRLVKEYLSKNPDASKKEVMEKFDVSDAMFYNIRKQLQGSKLRQSRTSRQNLVKSVKEKTARASKVMTASDCGSISLGVPASGMNFTLELSQGKSVTLHICNDGLYLSETSEVKTVDTLLTWDNFLKLQTSGLLDKK